MGRIEKEILRMTVNGHVATGYYTGEGKNFIILEGSDISPLIHGCCSPHVMRLRKENACKIRNGKLIENVLFTSPSTAAAFVVGYPVNGYRVWKKGPKYRIIS